MEQIIDSNQMEKFKDILTNQIDRILEQARVSRLELNDENNRETEYIDQAAVHSDQSMRLRLRSRESRLLNKLRLALERIDNGTYGECEVCGEPISIKRLEARPMTTKCIHCKEAEELLESIFK
ncbi:TraR/DksA family transcriptional regulator [Desulfobacter curvatus]|uniref:TraR/DksA family transcriptional regulator n=1 Tax=Desulfobacter curvatus TaxID=2290 RepID=UPI000375017C|nr:TraR/DksA C4-type zinc finger protein [Desulfobacter curvatus]